MPDLVQRRAGTGTIEDVRNQVRVRRRGRAQRIDPLPDERLVPRRAQLLRKCLRGFSARKRGRQLAVLLVEFLQ